MSSESIVPEYLDPPDVAALVGVSAAIVREWIDTKQLRATNVSRGKQPRWRVRISDLRAFMSTRSNQATTESSRNTELTTS
ncbi:MAG: helix-turn-helix domain-containing protein [Planctomycetaceae bacterium]|nr:helix-turn-helix domain-containing protein [Planctomycetaceae bacterium]